MKLTAKRRTADTIPLNRGGLRQALGTSRRNAKLKRKLLRRAKRLQPQDIIVVARQMGIYVDDLLAPGERNLHEQV